MKVLQKSYQTLWIYLLVAVLIVMYASTLTAEPLTWMDDSIISYLGAMQNGNATLWSNPEVRPMPLFIFSFLRSFGDGNIFLFHLLNVVSHAANSILLFMLMRRYQQSFYASIVAAALFGLHSMHAGTIAWISQLPLIFSLTILLFSALMYGTYCRTHHRIYLLPVAILAMMFHLTVNGGMQFVLMLIIVDILERRTLTRTMLYQKVPFIVLGVISIYVSGLPVVGLYYDSVNFVRFGIIEELLKFLTFTQQTGISPLGEIIEKNTFFGYSIVPLLVPFIVAAVFWYGRDHKIIIFSAMGFVLFGLPLVSWSAAGEWILNSERFYISSIFIIIPITFFLNRYNEKLFSNRIMKVGIISSTIFLAGFMTVHASRSTEYRKTNIVFWTYLKNEYPQNDFILNKLGTYHFNRYEIVPALQNFSQSISLHPSYYEAYNNRGLAYLSIYKTDSAIADFSHAIKLFPRYALAYYNLSSVYSLLSDWENTIQCCTKAIDLQPDFVQAFNNRANTYAKQKKYVQTFADYETAVRIDPRYADIYGNRALIYLETGNATNAIRDFKKQSEILPRRFDILIHLGLSYIIVRDTANAVEAFTRAKELDSKNSTMYLSAVQMTFLQDRNDIELFNHVVRIADPRP